jgi:hypothetical protein
MGTGTPFCSLAWSAGIAVGADPNLRSVPLGRGKLAIDRQRIVGRRFAKHALGYGPWSAPVIASRSGSGPSVVRAGDRFAIRIRRYVRLPCYAHECCRDARTVIMARQVRCCAAVQRRVADCPGRTRRDGMHDWKACWVQALAS